MYYSRKLRRRRTMEVVTAYTCDTYYEPGMGLRGLFCPTIKEYFDAHGANTDCEFIKVEIRIIRVPISPEEEEERHRLYQEKREKSPW